jgi:H+/Cl- antiporter ClcA
MKKIREMLLVKTMLVVGGVFFFLFMFLYALLKNFLLEHISDKEVFSAYNTLWIWILLFAVFLFTIIVIYIKKKIIEIENDIKAIKEYSKELSEYKNYEASINIKHSKECLETSIYLKNLAKRLLQKEKKSSKK